MKRLCAVIALVAAACSSDDTEDTPDALQAPMLMEVVPMEGALHISWMNVASGAESVEAERKTGDGDFVAAFSVPGTVDNEMDETATDDMSYTYRLRAKKGSSFSPYSNEIFALVERTEKPRAAG